MSKRMNISSAVLAVTLLAAMGAITRIAGAQKSGVPKPQNNLALGEDEVKQLLLLIDTGKRGKISKREWMKFMDAEFDRVDVEKNEELDLEEVAKSRLRLSRFASAGK